MNGFPTCETQRHLYASSHWGVFVRQHPLIMLRPCVTHLLQQWYCRSLVRSSTYFLVAHTKYCTTKNSCGHKQHGHGLIPPFSDSIWLVGEMVHGVISNYLWHFCFVFFNNFLLLKDIDQLDLLVEVSIIFLKKNVFHDVMCISLIVIVVLSVCIWNNYSHGNTMHVGAVIFFLFLLNIRVCLIPTTKSNHLKDWTSAQKAHADRILVVKKKNKETAPVTHQTLSL